MNTESGVVLGSVEWQRMFVQCTGGHIVVGLWLVITKFRWRYRWALFYRVVLGKGTKRRNFYAVRLILLLARHRIGC